MDVIKLLGKGEEQMIIPHLWRTRPRRLLWTLSLTQGSLADVCAGGSSNNKLGVTADLLGTRPTKCCQSTRHVFL